MFHGNQIFQAAKGKKIQAYIEKQIANKYDDSLEKTLTLGKIEGRRRGDRL